jgi:hypothetical protein
MALGIHRAHQPRGSELRDAVLDVRAAWAGSRNKAKASRHDLMATPTQLRCPQLRTSVDPPAEFIVSLQTAD